jgi:glycosyltransferase involved in cell wall biosynthesis
VVPVYQNADTLRELHARLAAALDGAVGEDGWEAVFVNDACPAGSLEVLRGLAAEDERVVVLSLRENAGQNAAVLVGLGHARGETAVVMDADLQDPPEAVPVLIEELGGTNAAAVFAGRRGRYESRWRAAASRAFKWGLHLLSGRRLPPDAGLFVAMRREMIGRLMANASRRPYVVGMIGRAGLPVRSVPVRREESRDGGSGYRARDLLRLGWWALCGALRPPRGPRARKGETR